MAVAIKGGPGSVGNLTTGRATTVASQGVRGSMKATTSTVTASKTLDPSVNADGQFIDLDCTAGNLTITMPAASSYDGIQVTMQKSDATSSTAAISTVNGGTITLTGQYDSVTVWSNGSAWKLKGVST